MNNSPYQQKLDRNIKAFDWFILLISLAVVIGGIGYACHEFRNQPGPDLPPDHSSLDSGWIEEHSEKVDSPTLFRFNPMPDGWSVVFDERPEGSTDVCYTSGGVWKTIARKAPHRPWKVVDSVLWRRWWDTLRLVKVIRQNEAVLRLREKEDSL